MGTSSYGAVPVRFDDLLNSESDNENDTDDVRRRDRRRHSQQTRSAIPEQGFHSHRSHMAERFPTAPRTRRRRASSNATEIGMGIDSKASFAAGGPIMKDSSPENADSMRSQSSPSESEDEDKDDDNPIDNSPYPEVRASVPPTDNTSLSISTPRMWTLSLLFALGGSATNLFFSLRYPSVAITPVIALVLVHPLGKLWDALLKYDDDPRESFHDGVRNIAVLVGSHASRKSSFRLWLAQGKWNEKEHACVYISSNVSFGFAFATDVIVEQHKFYKQDVPILYQILLTISTQILGYAFAGLTRRYLVRPAAMIWPGTLMSTAMFTTMHQQENKIANGWTISRYRFFVYVWIGAFAWYFLPGLLMPALSYFNVVTWFAPDNVVVANLVSLNFIPRADPFLSLSLYLI